MLFLDGVYAEGASGKLRFHRVKAPTHRELDALVHRLSHRVARSLEKRGLLERDAENTWLTLEEEDDDVLSQLEQQPGVSRRFSFKLHDAEGTPFTVASSMVLTKMAGRRVVITTYEPIDGTMQDATMCSQSPDLSELS